MPQVGDILLDKYRIVRQLGEGGMGSVHEAVHEQIGKHVAVKVLHKELSQNPDLVTRFTREAQAAGAIGHRSIIDVHDIGTGKDGTLFLVMEYLKGQNLAEALQQAGPLDFSVACYVIGQVLSALYAAHEKDIVHRDLKPDNIFLVSTGQALPDIKLLDFGISKMLQSGSPEDRLTKTGTIMGTPYYMAPEQARGRKDLDYEVDIYAMGVILYEALTGRVPFWAENTFALVYEIINSPVVPPKQFRPDMPDELEAIIMKALDREPENRWNNAAEMLYALMPFMDEQSKGRISLPQDGADPESTGNAGIASLSGIRRDPTGSSKIPGTLHSSPGTPMAWTASGSSGVQEPKKSKLGLIIGIAAAFLILGGGGITALVFALSSDTPTSVPQPPPPVVASQPSETNDPVANGTGQGQGEQNQGADQQVEVTPPEHQMITVSLNGLPEGARVTLDGEPVEGHEISRPQSSESHEIIVQADGHTPWNQTITFSENRDLQVALVPEPGQEAASVADQEGPAKRPRIRRNKRGREQDRNQQDSQNPNGIRRKVPRFDRSFQFDRSFN